MFRIFRRRQAQPAAQPSAQRPPALPTNQLHRLDQPASAPARGNTILTNEATAEPGTSAALALFLQQHQAPDPRLLTKAERLAELHARPLGWSNTLPVVIRPEPDELAYLRAAHQAHEAQEGPRISPAPISGTPPWHPEPE